eukprot:scaffold210726_cov29-Prasinocladus_malaysianus.AAC.1
MLTVDMHSQLLESRLQSIYLIFFSGEPHFEDVDLFSWAPTNLDAPQAAAFRAYAYIAHAQSRMDSDDAAQALRSSQEASDCASKATSSAEAFDKTEVRRHPEEHAAFRKHLSNTVSRAADRIRRINSMVHYKAPAQDLPELPEPSHLADAV